MNITNEPSGLVGLCPYAVHGEVQLDLSVADVNEGSITGNSARAQIMNAGPSLWIDLELLKIIHHTLEDQSRLESRHLQGEYKLH